MALPAPRSAPAEVEQIVARLRAGGPAVVALSGGVDSAVVAALALEALGPRACAVTVTGPAVASSEVRRAREVAAFLGLEHHLLGAELLADPEYVANGADRCFFCRRGETHAIRRWSDGRGFLQFLDGIQSDDLGDRRPGIAAMEAAGFDHPLVRAGWGKREVRALARARGLPNRDAPSEACLASRIRHGQSVTLELLRRVERSEARLYELGFTRVRVRTDGRSARVEVDPEEVRHLLSPPTAARATSALLEEGFVEVTLDPDGYGRHAGA